MGATVTVEIILLCPSEGNIFCSFVDFVAVSILVLLGYLSRPINQVMGIVVDRCRCICREEVRRMVN